jgi:hypothetical protein
MHCFHKRPCKLSLGGRDLAISGSELDTSLNLDALNLAFSKLVGHVLKRAPLNSLMLIDPFDQPLMHHQNLRLTTDLRVNADRKNKMIVFSVAELELFLPKPFDLMRVDKS